MLKSVTLAATLALSAGAALAGDGSVHEVKMLKKGAEAPWFSNRRSSRPNPVSC